MATAIILEPGIQQKLAVLGGEAVPGIGPRSTDRMIEARRQTRPRDLSQLRALGATAWNRNQFDEHGR